jgi:hypothetical protein
MAGVSLSALIGIAAFAACSQAMQQTDSDCKAAVAAYSSSINSFPQYRCKFRIRVGAAATLREAKEGKLTGVVSYDSVVVVDFDKEFFECFAPPQSKEMPGKSKQGAFWATPVSGESPTRYMTDGVYDFSNNLTLQAATLVDKKLKPPSVSFPFVPLSMFMVEHRNVNGPDVWLRSTSNYYTFHPIGLQEVDGVPVISFDFTAKPPPGRKLNRKYSYSLNPSKGHMPVRKIMYRDGEEFILSFVTNYRDCGKGRWFPGRCIRAIKADGGTGYLVDEIQVIELDVDRASVPADFEIVVPSKTQVRADDDSTKSLIYLKQDEKVGLADLPILYQMLQDKKDNPNMDTGLDAHRPRRWNKWLWTSFGIVLASTGALVLWKRRFPARPSHETKP